MSFFVQPNGGYDGDKENPLFSIALLDLRFNDPSYENGEPVTNYGTAGNLHNGTIQGTQCVATGESLILADTKRVDIANPGNLIRRTDTPFTLFVDWDHNGSNNLFQTMIWFGPDSSTGHNSCHFSSPRYGTHALQWYDNTTSRMYATASTKTFARNQTVWAYDGIDTVTIYQYINGVEGISSTTSSFTPDYTLNNPACRIGMNWDGHFYSRGPSEFFRISMWENYIMPIEEVRTLPE